MGERGGKLLAIENFFENNFLSKFNQNAFVARYRFRVQEENKLENCP